MSKGLSDEKDHDSLYRITSYLYDELRRTPWWRLRRQHRLGVALDVLDALYWELLSRGDLRSATMFTEPGDTSARPVKL